MIKILLCTFISMESALCPSPTWLCCGTNGQGNFVDFAHDVLVGFVYLHKHLGFSRQLTLNVRCREDTLQVHPGSLAVQPFILPTNSDSIGKHQKDGQQSIKWQSSFTMMERTNPVTTDNKTMARDISKGIIYFS